MKKTVKILLVGLLMTLFLAGCSGNDSQEEGEESTQAQVDQDLDQEGASEKTDGKDSDGEEAKKDLEGEISFAAWGSEAEAEVDRELCQAFMEKYPKTKVNLDIINDDYLTAVETRYLGGKSPDVIYAHPKQLARWKEKGMLEPMNDVYEAHDEWFDEDVYMTDLYDEFKFDGDYYGVPNGAESLLVFYNKDLIDQVGGDYPNKDMTWDEFNDLLVKCTIKNDDGTAKAYGGSPDEVGYYGLQAYIYANGGSMVDDINNPKKATFNSPEVIEVLKNYQDKLLKDHSVPFGSDWDEIPGGFSGGQIGLMITGVYDMVTYKDLDEFEWDVGQLPMAEDGSNAVVVAGYGVFNQGENIDLAKEFAAFCLGDEGQEILAKSGLTTVANKEIAGSDEVLNFEGAPDHNELRLTTLENAKNIDLNTLAWQEMQDTVILPTIYQLSLGEITPEECAESINDGIQDLLDQANSDSYEIE